MSFQKKYLVDTAGTSDGTQDKYFCHGVWYKIDAVGEEGRNEEIVSKVLSLSNLDAEQYVVYEQIKINGQNTCMSRNFTGKGEQFISLQRLYANVRGGNLTALLQGEDPADAIDYVDRFVQEQTGLDIKTYLANTIMLDQITLNTDRHLNNLGIIYNAGTGRYREAPIFDNGRAFFCGDKKYDPGKSIAEKQKTSCIPSVFCIGKADGGYAIEVCDTSH